MQQGKGGRRPRSITYPGARAAVIVKFGFSSSLFQVIFWVVFTALTLFAILDRFYIHLWEMSFNTAPLPTLFAAPVPYSITFFDNFGRAFGRVFLVSMNALFWTQCKTSENFLMEHHPRWVDLGDLRSVHNRIHYVLGLFFMGIPMVAHCLLIFLPGLSGQPLLVTGPTPVSAVNQFVWANNLLPEVFLTHDNVWRLIMVIALFGVVFPFSVSNYARRKWYGPSLLLHILAAVLFTIDQLRRSPHAQVFSMPVIAYYLLDRFIGLWLHRTGQVSIVHKELLDHDYMVVFLQLGGVKRRRLVGSTLYVQFTGLEGVMDFAHPFVAFQNHSGEQLSPEWTNREGAAAKNYKFYKDRSGAERKFVRRNRGGEEDTELEEKNGADEDEGMYFSSWNTAVIVQIHRWNSGEESFTTKLSRKEVSSRLRYWGPYVTDYANITPDGRFLPPLVLIASGTGAGPLIDFYMHFTANNMELRNQVLVYFSTNSQGLFQFVTGA